MLYFKGQDRKKVQEIMRTSGKKDGNVLQNLTLLKKCFTRALIIFGVMGEFRARINSISLRFKD